ncbi:MAG TPA: hypothetical protein VJN00_01465 [Steroidobacteraceae bacterium]|nr:hypothetical protein [Steroidobacteraceae bacterium]
MKSAMTVIRHLHAVGLVLAATFCIAACGGGGGGNNDGGGNEEPPPPPPGVQVAISPGSALLQPGDTQAFTATVSNAADSGVTWSVNDIEGGDATVGVISDNGLYTAPDTVPAPDTVTVAATSDEDSTKSASAAITIVDLGTGANNVLLKGRYAFVFAGSETEAGVFVAGGTFVADGAGQIRNGREDGNFAGGIFERQGFNGVYAIGDDRRGVMIIANTADADCGCAPTQFTFMFNVVSNRLAHFIEFDDAGAGRGTIEKQDTDAFSPQTLDGSFVFLVDGLDFETRLSIAGRFTSASGSLSEAIADINNSGTVSTAQDIGGELTLGENGRGEATLTTPLGDLHFAYYVVSRDKLLWVGMDFFPVLSGSALRQNAPSFSNASLFGRYVFGMTATTHPRPQKVIRADAGYFDADGAGEIPDGVLDRNSAGSVLEGSALSGSYGVAAGGRGTAVLDTEDGQENIVFYLASDDEGFVLQVDESDSDVNNVASGRLRRQETTVFSEASFEGGYGLALTGSSDGTDPVNVSGSLLADGAGTLATVQDIYAGALSPDQDVDGTFAIPATGRGTVTFPTDEMNLYLITDTEAFLMGMDSGKILFGTALKQE